MSVFEEISLIDLKSPASVDQFQIGSVIGKGQFSVVHRALYLPEKKTVAIKRIHLFEMIDSKARTDCVKEIALLKVLCTADAHTFQTRYAPVFNLFS